MKILVSGVGGDIGLGLGRILKEWNLFERIYGIDISEDHPASLVFDEVDVAPYANSDSYLEWLYKYITDNKIDVFVPTSEAEILVVSNHLEVLSSCCKILINDNSIIALALDKNKTLKYLSERGVSVPSHGLVSECNTPCKFPVIVKPRFGQGSKSVVKVNSSDELCRFNEEYVWQEFLEPDEEEYTCAVYVSKSLETRILVLKRVLIGGYTGKAVVTRNNEIEEYLQEIIMAFGVAGLYNVQLRLTASGPLLFEINPRISSTVVFRDKLGFTDFKWWVFEALGIALPDYSEVQAGKRIYRGNAEYILDIGQIKPD